MSPSSEKDNVTAALSKLRWTIDDEKERLKEEVAQAMKDGEYDSAAAVIQFAQRLLGFQAEVEGLIGKWEELEDIRDTAPPRVRPTVNSRSYQNTPSPQASHTPRKPRKGITDSTVYCHHILEALVAQGGSAANQTISAAVNTKIRMLYPAFKQARALLVQEGWTNNTGSNQSMEISAKGIKWLQSQMAHAIGDSHRDHSSPRSRWEIAPNPPIEAKSETGAQKTPSTPFDDDAFDQI
jgi:hypothetical protein